MAEGQTIGAQLRELQRQSGRSYEEIASRAGYKTKSGVQRYFSDDYDRPYLPLETAEKLARGFDGSKVRATAIMALAGLPDTNAKVAQLGTPSDMTIERDLPIYGTAIASTREISGHAIEQTTLNTGEVVGYIARPPILRNIAHAYALYVQGESMTPRYDDGELIIATHGEKGRPPSIKDDVVVYLRDMEDEEGDRASAVLVKRLVRKTASFYELEQYFPPLKFQIEVSKVLRVDRVLPRSEMLA